MVPAVSAKLSSRVTTQTHGSAGHAVCSPDFYWYQQCLCIMIHTHIHAPGSNSNWTLVQPEPQTSNQVLAAGTSTQSLESPHQSTRIGCLDSSLPSVLAQCPKGPCDAVSALIARPLTQSMLFALALPFAAKVSCPGPKRSSPCHPSGPDPGHFENH